MRPRAPPDGRRHREHSAGWLDSVDDVPVFLLGKRKTNAMAQTRVFGEDRSLAKIIQWEKAEL